jgi:probable F420-dependent oxidoreductase
MAIEIGSVGVWTPPHVWQGSKLTEVVAELEELGYGAFWLGGSPPGDLRSVEELLAATTTMPIGTSIVNVWTTDPEQVAAAYQRVSAGYPGRFVLGIGAGHPEQGYAAYARPYRRLVEFLDVFDTANVSPAHRMLAALGPRTLALAADRAAGALPYLVTPEHTRLAREILGGDRLLAPEQKVVLETDPERARAIARDGLRMYLSLTNYTGTLRRLGFTEDDLAGGGSDRLVDGLVAWGDEDAIRARVAEHHEAGADHVAIQLLTGGDGGLADYRRLAPALLGLRR